MASLTTVAWLGEEVAQMTTNSNTPIPSGRRSLWFRIGKFLFVVVLAVAVFLLGLSMVHHRFFRGGYINQHGVLKP
jgi:hypothetical protein